MNWNLKDIYEDTKIWQDDLTYIESKIGDFAKFKGHLLDSDGNALFDFLNLELETSTIAERLGTYAFLYKDIHLDDDLGFDLLEKLSAVSTKLSSASSYFEPEILSVSKEEFFSKFENDERFPRFANYFNELFRAASHVLNEDQEFILSHTSELTNAYDVFEALNEIDLTFEPVLLPDGTKEVLNHATYSKFLIDQKHEIRKQAFTNMHNAYKSMNNTFAKTFIANLKEFNFYRKLKNFEGPLDAALFSRNIPTDVYRNLITSAHNHLPSFYEYAKLRKKALKLDDIHLFDFYAPITNIESSIPFDEAFEQVKKSLSILGEDYVETLDVAVRDKWVDVYPNETKTSGAYSCGPNALKHPYVLLNQTDDLNSMFTMAHEFGHMMHSYYSNKNCDPLYADYSIFVAEVASTVNEVLLMLDLLENNTDNEMKKHLIAEFLDKFKSTFFRQTQFAEFELIAHEKIANGEPLSKTSLNDLYYDLNKLYFGEDVFVDEVVKYEWSRIPHFYTPFYVYQYATGFASAIYIANRIHKKEAGAVEQYRQFLTLGGTLDPIDELKTVGADLTKPEVIDNALKFFDDLIKELEKLV